MFIEIGEYENVIESQKFVDEIRAKKLNIWITEKSQRGYWTFR